MPFASLDDIRTFCRDLPGGEQRFSDIAAQRQQNLTKPPGSLGRLEEPEDQPGRSAHLVRLAGQRHQGSHRLGVSSDQVVERRPGGVRIDGDVGLGRGTGARQLQGQRGGAPFESQAMAGGEKAKAQRVAAGAGCGVALEESKRGPARLGVLRGALEKAGVQGGAHGHALTRLIAEKEDGARALGHGYFSRFRST